MTRTNKRPPTGQITDDSSPTRISEPNCPIVNRLNYWPAQGPNILSPNTTDSARRIPKIVATLPAKSGQQPSDPEFTAQLHPGPPPPSGRAKVATRYYQFMTTQLGTRPDLPLLYGPSLGACLPTQKSTANSTPGPPPLSDRAKVTTRYYRTITTLPDTRPDLPLLYGPSFRASPPTRSPVPGCTGTCGSSPQTPATNANRTATQAYTRRRPSDLPLLNGPSRSKTAADR